MKTITLCASVSAYPSLLGIKQQLDSRGYHVMTPNLEVKRETTLEKQQAIREHFDRIAISDAILVVNEPKHNMPGYIGPNVLMEMGLAFYLKKTIYLFNAPHPALSNFAEICALLPKVLDGDLSHLLQ